MEFIVAAVIVAVMGVILYTRRREHLDEAHRHVARRKKEKEAWGEEKFLSYGEVQDLVQLLKTEIEERIEDEEKKGILTDIITEWADLRVRTFQERRTWVRKPEIHDVETSIRKHYDKIHH